MKHHLPFYSLALALLSALVLSGCLETIPQVPCTDSNCPLCRGYGNYRCNDCFGRGQKQCTSCSGRGMTNGYGAAAQKCFGCNGTGLAQCWSCNGSGMKRCTKPAPGYGPTGYNANPGGYGASPSSLSTAGGYRPPVGYRPPPNF